MAATLCCGSVVLGERQLANCDGSARSMKFISEISACIAAFGLVSWYVVALWYFDFGITIPMG